MDKYKNRTPMSQRWTSAIPLMPVPEDDLEEPPSPTPMSAAEDGESSGEEEFPEGSGRSFPPNTTTKPKGA